MPKLHRAHIHLDSTQYAAFVISVEKVFDGEEKFIGHVDIQTSFGGWSRQWDVCISTIKFTTFMSFLGSLYIELPENTLDISTETVEVEEPEVIPLDESLDGTVKTITPEFDDVFDDEFYDDHREFDRETGEGAEAHTEPVEDAPAPTRRTVLLKAVTSQRVAPGVTVEDDEDEDE